MLNYKHICHTLSKLSEKSDFPHVLLCGPFSIFKQNTVLQLLLTCIFFKQTQNKLRKPHIVWKEIKVTPSISVVLYSFQNSLMAINLVKNSYSLTCMNSLNNNNNKANKLLTALLRAMLQRKECAFGSAVLFIH